MIRELILKNRSYRRFHEDRPVNIDTLLELVDLARLSPSAANLQPLKFMLAADPETNSKIFPTLAWAGYLKDWPGPAEGERPTAYITILADTEIRKETGCDQGIAAQSILLGAVDKGLGGCMIGSIDRKTLREELSIPERYEILLVLALGYPKEAIILTEAKEGDIHYYREGLIHYVPKRPLGEIVL